MKINEDDVLNLVKDLGDPKDIKQQIRKKIDFFRRRVSLDRLISRSQKICEIHGHIYYPKCRTRNSPFF